MTARELIEQEFVAHGGNPKVCEAEPHGYDLAAERVIDRLQRRVEELEQQVRDLEVTSQFGIADSKTMKRERYRDRLDRGVFQILSGYGRCVDDALTLTKLGIAAIDAEVEERK